VLLVMTEKRVVSVTVNNNNSGSDNVGQSTNAHTTTSSLSVNSGACRPDILPPNPTTALLQTYLTLNNLARTSGDNCVPSTTVAVNHLAPQKSLSDA